MTATPIPPIDIFYRSVATYRNANRSTMVLSCLAVAIFCAFAAMEFFQQRSYGLALAMAAPALFTLLLLPIAVIRAIRNASDQVIEISTNGIGVNDKLTPWERISRVRERDVGLGSQCYIAFVRRGSWWRFAKILLGDRRLTYEEYRGITGPLAAYLRIHHPHVHVTVSPPSPPEWYDWLPDLT